MHKFWFPGWRYGEALGGSRVFHPGKARELDGFAGARGLIERLDNLHINEPLFSRGLGLLVFQNTIREINDLRSKLIPFPVLVDLPLFVLEYFNFDRSLIFVGVGQPQRSFCAKDVIRRM